MDGQGIFLGGAINVLVSYMHVPFYVSGIYQGPTVALITAIIKVVHISCFKPQYHEVLTPLTWLSLCDIQNEEAEEHIIIMDVHKMDRP